MSEPSALGLMVVPSSIIPDPTPFIEDVTGCDEYMAVESSTSRCKLLKAQSYGGDPLSRKKRCIQTRGLREKGFVTGAQDGRINGPCSSAMWVCVCVVCKYVCGVSERGGLLQRIEARGARSYRPCPETPRGAKGDWIQQQEQKPTMRL